MLGRRSNGRVQCVLTGTQNQGLSQTPRSLSPPRPREPKFKKVFNKKPEKKIIVADQAKQQRTQIRVKHHSPEKQKQQMQPQPQQFSTPRLINPFPSAPRQHKSQIQSAKIQKKVSQSSKMQQSSSSVIRSAQPKSQLKQEKLSRQKQNKIQSMVEKLDRIGKLNQIIRTTSGGSLVQKEENKQVVRPSQKRNSSSTFVDSYYSRPEEFIVYTDKIKNFSYSITMNQSHVESNINKFYIMQILENIKNPDQCYFFSRWGRVGLAGQTSEIGPMSAEQAVKAYHAKLLQKMQKGYKTVQVQYQSDRRNFYFPKVHKKNAVKIQSKLDIRVQNLIKLIFDMKMMNNQLKEQGYDAKRMPLGKLAKSSIVKGYEALKELMEEIKGKKRKESINQWSSLFYSHIPHDFGMKNISNYAMDTEQKVKNKLQLLQSLQDIQIFTKMIDQIPENIEENQLDINYQKLKVNIQPLQKEDPAFRVIMKYVENTHAQKHNNYTLQVDTIYVIKSEVEEQRYQQFKGLPNKQLLWHGSRLTNYVGILSQGLRIAPPEAPTTGYMFGKGLYFADVVSKSANYCQATKANPIGCLLLCEVALGESVEKCFADYNANLMTAQFHSTKGVGKSSPSEGQSLEGVFVPNGPIVPTGISNTSLSFNEYVVYNVNQVKMRYLLRLKFLFK